VLAATVTFATTTTIVTLGRTMATTLEVAPPATPPATTLVVEI
jgi:hypothetical protein